MRGAPNSSWPWAKSHSLPCLHVLGDREGEEHEDGEGADEGNCGGITARDLLVLTPPPLHSESSSESFVLFLRVLRPSVPEFAQRHLIQLAALHTVHAELVGAVGECAKHASLACASLKEVAILVHGRARFQCTLRRHCATTVEPLEKHVQVSPSEPGMVPPETAATATVQQSEGSSSMSPLKNQLQCGGPNPKHPCRWFFVSCVLRAARLWVT